MEDKAGCGLLLRRLHHYGTETMRVTLCVLSALLLTIDSSAIAEDITVHVIKLNTGRPVKGMPIWLRLVNYRGKATYGPVTAGSQVGRLPASAEWDMKCSNSCN